MGMCKFEITVNGFLLRTYFSETEESGLKWCKRYASQFQKKVINSEVKVLVYRKEKQKERWQYHGKPYLYDRTLVKKSRKSIVDDNDTIRSKNTSIENNSTFC